MESKKTTKVYILDSSALIGGINPANLKRHNYISPLVEKETERNALIKERIRCAIEERKLTVREPSKDSLNKVTEAAQRLGEASLSRADLETAALALDLREEEFEPVLVSDDYSVENLCESIQIKYASMITMGIQRLFRWIYYCPGCRRQNPTSGICPICGTLLKRKPKPAGRTQHREI